MLAPTHIKDARHTWAARGCATPDPRGFWDAQPRSHPRQHSGVRSKLILHSSPAIGGYKRSMTPPMGSKRDPSIPVPKSKVGRQMMPVDTVTAINGRPIDYPELGRRGPVYPAGVLAENLRLEKRRLSAWTNEQCMYREQPPLQVENATAIKLASAPLYSSFGQGDVFDPTVFMSKRWKDRMVTQGRATTAPSKGTNDW